MPAKNPPRQGPRSDHTFLKNRKALKYTGKKNGLPCHLCLGALGPIDWDGPPGAPLSFEADHKIPLNKGGDLRAVSNLACSHSVCNRRRQDLTVEQFQARYPGGIPTRSSNKGSTVLPPVTKPKTTRRWY